MMTSTVMKPTTLAAVATISSLCHNSNVQRDNDDVNNVFDRVNICQLGVNSHSNPVSSNNGNRRYMSFGTCQDPTDTESSMGNHAAVCDLCDNVSSHANLINRRCRSVNMVLDSLYNPYNSDNDGVASTRDRKIPCCDFPNACFCDPGVIWHPEIVSSRRFDTVCVEHPPLAWGKGVSEMPESVTGALRLTVDWCLTCPPLPAVLLLLLLPLRLKGMRPGVVQMPNVLLLLCLLLSHCLALPWIEENEDSVMFRARICQPVPDEHLRHMLGSAFDKQRMSSEHPLASRRRRADLSVDHDMDDAALDSYSVADGVALSGQIVRQALVSNLEKLEEEKEEIDEGWMIDKVTGMEREGEMKEVKREDIMEEEEEQLYPQRTDSGSDQRKPPTNTQPPYHSMKRHNKRQASPDNGGVPDMKDLATRDKNSSSRRKGAQLPKQLLQAGRNRMLKDKSKKMFQKEALKLDPTPWTCNISKYWAQTVKDIFPRYLLDGRCSSDKCFYNRYECVPQRYRIKLLQRDPNYCNPLPAVAANSTYEQRWTVIRYYAIVGCSCESPDPLRMY